MMTHEYYALTKEEQKELADKIAAGGVTRACRKAKIDWFNVKLRSGRRVCGSYRWGSENSEFIRFRLYEK